MSASAPSARRSTSHKHPSSPRASPARHLPIAAALRYEATSNAECASLRYVTGEGPGIRRVRQGKGFRYVDARGKAVRDPDVLERIRNLVLPPAWEDVWICPYANGHLQATGRDARGRKQYRYHDRWRTVRDEIKFGRMFLFGLALPTIRRRVRRDLALPGTQRERVLATLVRLLETSHIRVGNDEYARTNGSYGLTTLQDKHAEVHGETIHFEFEGKSGKEHVVEVKNPRLAKVVKRCRDLPGPDLFQYVDAAGKRRRIHSSDVNHYLHEITGQDFTAKDFRTWAATLSAARLLRNEQEIAASTKAAIRRVIKSVSEELGNTPAVCRRSYVHPAILKAYETGCLGDVERTVHLPSHVGVQELTKDETALLGILRDYLPRIERRRRAR
jgi:DNA topoisomerase-1